MNILPDICSILCGSLYLCFAFLFFFSCDSLVVVLFFFFWPCIFAVSTLQLFCRERWTRTPIFGCHSWRERFFWRGTNPPQPPRNFRIPEEVSLFVPQTLHSHIYQSFHFLDLTFDVFWNREWDIQFLKTRSVE